MPGWRRLLSYGRKYQTLAVLVVIVFLFYWFQFFSHKKLNGWNMSHSNHEIWERRHPKLDHNIESKILDHQDERLLNLKTRIRGVHPNDVEDYRTVDGMFHCLKSKQVIRAEYLNDDFCDCSDSTDEPGTSACPNSRFEKKVLFV